MLACAGLAVALWLARGPLLRGWAQWWIIDHGPAKADALVIYAGGTPMPTLTAARLFREGFATNVIVLNGRLRPTDRLGLSLPTADFRRQLLVSNGVPEAAITLVGRELPNTFEETAALRDWAKSNHVARLLAVTEITHTRRAAWCAAELLRPAGVEWRVAAVQPLDYSVADWWLKEAGLIAFENEFVLWLYYKAKY